MGRPAVWYLILHLSCHLPTGHLGNVIKTFVALWQLLNLYINLNVLQACLLSRNVSMVLSCIFVIDVADRL